MFDHLNNQEDPQYYGEKIHFEKFKVSQNSLIYRVERSIEDSILKFPSLQGNPE